MIKRTVNRRGRVRINNRFYKPVDGYEVPDGLQLRFRTTNDAMFVEELDEYGIELVGFWILTSNPATGVENG